MSFSMEFDRDSTLFLNLLTISYSRNQLFLVPSLLLVVGFSCKQDISKHRIGFSTGIAMGLKHGTEKQCTC